MTRKHSYNPRLSSLYIKAKAEGRLCSNCGWIVTKERVKKGKTLCANCNAVINGRIKDNPHGAWLDEPQDKTGESL